MIREQLTDFGARQALRMMRRFPDRSIPILLDAMDVLARGNMVEHRRLVREGMENKESNVYKLTMRAIDEVDPCVLEKLIVNFVTNVTLGSWPLQEEMRAKHECNIPWAILLDPTSACNLHCKGCWAADYGNKLNLTVDDIDSIVSQGKELGIHLYIYTGGEPLVRKSDLITLCERHQDCIFLTFTNGTLIDQKFCDELLRVANLVPAISVEGGRETTDSRRGEGTYRKVMRAMELMHENGLPFGVSCCYTSQNFESISSEEFVEQLIEFGALFAWFFHYMPVGSDANVDLLCSPEQREAMYHTIRRWRTTKPIFPMDFQNDGQFTQGCIAGGRRYLHINASGDVDPCVFIHFSDSNIHEKTLLECLKGPLFKAYYEGQPFNDNHLMPCPMLENPQELRRIIEKTGARSSNLEGEETVETLCGRCDEYAKLWEPTAKRLWEANHKAAPFRH